MFLAGSDAWMLLPCIHPRTHHIAGQRRVKTQTQVVLDPSVIEAAAPVVFQPRGVTTQDTIVFAIGVLPFAWASAEFWRRIAVGQPFGTGKDSIIIGEDQNPESSRGRRTLGKVRIFEHQHSHQTQYCASSHSVMLCPAGCVSCCIRALCNRGGVARPRCTFW